MRAHAVSGLRNCSAAIASVREGLSEEDPQAAKNTLQVAIINSCFMLFIGKGVMLQKSMWDLIDFILKPFGTRRNQTTFKSFLLIFIA